jgi:hypothetical protein
MSDSDFDKFIERIHNLPDKEKQKIRVALYLDWGLSLQEIEKEEGVEGLQIALASMPTMLEV